MCDIIITIGIANTINHIVSNLICMSVQAANIGIMIGVLPKNIPILDNTIIHTKLTCFDVLSVDHTREHQLI